MSRVVTFGEIMMRLNPEGYLRFVQADRFEVTYAGGEANVAVSLSNFGIDTAFVTKVPAHEIGKCAVNALARYGVNTNYILYGGPRLGVYYCEKGASQRPSKVIYDRAGSSIAGALSLEFDWERIFDGAQWFHWTGITPALSEEMAKACLDACKTAKALGVTVSCDLNYRKKLWSTEQAGITMKGLLPYVSVCIANEEDAKDVLGIKPEDNHVEKGILNKKGYISVAKQITHCFGCEKVAITLRESLSATDNDWSGILYNSDTDEAVFSQTYHIHIVDRIGGGDSFGGALIYGLLNGYKDQEAIDFAAAASCLKHTIEHDFNLVDIEEINLLSKGNISGRVQR